MEDISDLRCVECLSTHLHRSCVAGAPHTKRLRCAACAAEFPIVDGIVRMVPRDSALHAEEAAAPAAELDDSLQAEYWEDDGHGFRSPQDPIVRGFAEQRWRYLASRFDVGGTICRGWDTLTHRPILDLRLVIFTIDTGVYLYSE